MAFTGSPADQTAIRSLIDSYADAVFRRDAEQWASTWAEQAQWSLMGMRVEGRQAIVNMWQGAMASFKFVAFFSQVGAIEIDGDTATGRVFTHEILEDGEGNLSRPVGRYDDHYVKQAGHWRFKSREFTQLKG